MTDSASPTLDTAAGKRRRRLLLRKRLYQRLWGGRASNETPVVVFLAGTPGVGNGHVIHVLESNLDTEVYRADDPRAFEARRLRDDDALRQLIGKSSAPSVIFVTGGESNGIAPLIERFSPARVLWFYESCERFMARAPRVMDETVMRQFLWEHMERHDGSLPAELSSLIGDTRLEAATVWALVWYAIHNAYRRQRLDRRGAAHLIAERTLVSAPAATMGGLFEIIGVGAGRNKRAPRIRGKRQRGRTPALPDVVREACEELQTWLDTHAEDPADRS